MTDFGAVTELCFLAIFFLICAGVSLHRNIVYRKTGFWRGVFSKSVGIWVSVAVATAIAAGPVGRWHNDDRLQTSTPLPKSDYLDEKRGETAIVFVHGVLGNGDATFRHAVNNTYWPELLRQDPLFSESSIFIFNYFSVRWHPGQSFVNLADDLQTTLTNHKIFKHKHVVFLAHSMGGLVVRQLLVNHIRDKDVIEKVPFIYFFASPTTGNPMAYLGTVITDNEQFYRMRTDAVDMTALEGAWRKARLPIQSYCAYEGLGYLGGKLIVEKESAIHLCSDHVVQILKDHSEIVKPAHERDRPHLEFRNAYKNVLVKERIKNAQSILARAASELDEQAKISYRLAVDELEATLRMLNVAFDHDEWLEVIRNVADAELGLVRLAKGRQERIDALQRLEQTIARLERPIRLEEDGKPIERHYQTKYRNILGQLLLVLGLGESGEIRRDTFERSEKELNTYLATLKSSSNGREIACVRGTLGYAQMLRAMGESNLDYDLLAVAEPNLSAAIDVLRTEHFPFVVARELTKMLVNINREDVSAVEMSVAQIESLRAGRAKIAKNRATDCFFILSLQSENEWFDTFILDLALGSGLFALGSLKQANDGAEQILQSIRLLEEVERSIPNVGGSNLIGKLSIRSIISSAQFELDIRSSASEEEKLAAAARHESSLATLKTGGVFVGQSYRTLGDRLVKFADIAGPENRRTALISASRMFAESASLFGQHQQERWGSIKIQEANAQAELGWADSSASGSENLLRALELFKIGRTAKRDGATALEVASLEFSMSVIRAELGAREGDRAAVAEGLGAAEDIARVFEAENDQESYQNSMEAVRYFQLWMKSGDIDRQSSTRQRRLKFRQARDKPAGDMMSKRLFPQ